MSKWIPENIYTDDVADSKVLRTTAEGTIIPGLVGGSRRKEGWEESNKFNTKKESERSLDWFLHKWSEIGWELTGDEVKELKNYWRISGSPFISWTDPTSSQGGASLLAQGRGSYYMTSRAYNEITGEFEDNRNYYIGAPDIIALPYPGTEPRGPWLLLDEMGHALQFSHPGGVPGLNQPSKDDVNINMLSSKLSEIKGNPNHPDMPVRYDAAFQDSLGYAAVKQAKGQPWLGEDVIGKQEGPWVGRYGTFAITGEPLAMEASAHNLFSAAGTLNLIDALTGGDGEISKDDVDKVWQNPFGRELIKTGVIDYGFGSDAIYGEKRVGLEKFVYKPGKKKLVGGEVSEMVHFNPEIWTTDKRYKLAKKNRELWEEMYGEKAKFTYKAFEPLTKIPIEKLK